MEDRDYQAYWSDLTNSHAFHPGNQFRYRTITRELQKLNIKPRKVVDCGCGDGSLISSLRRIYPTSNYYGTDVADNVPANNPRSGVRFFKADLGQAVAGEWQNCFDLVVCSEVIEHVRNDDQLIANLAMMAKPGATIVLTTQTGQVYRTEQYLGHLRHYRIGDLCERLRRAGTEILTAYTCGWPFLNMQKVIAHHMFGSVQRLVIEPRRPSALVRLAMSSLAPVYMMSSRSRGPQIVIIASRAS